MSFKQVLTGMSGELIAEMDRIRRAAVNNFDTGRAQRYIVLAAQLEVLMDVTGRLSRRERDARKGVRLVVVAGPNEPEVLSVSELADVYAEFEHVEVDIYQRNALGKLVPVYQSPQAGPLDDQFAYWTTELHSIDGKSLGTVSWSRKRVGA